MTKNRRPPRLVPALTAAQEALLSAITDSGQFTLDKALKRCAGQVRLRPLTKVGAKKCPNE